jgi:hypothetical protein
MDIMTIISWATAIVTAASAIAARRRKREDYKALDFAALNFGKAKDKGDDGDKS